MLFRSPVAAGSVLLIALGLMAACIALAFAFVTVARTGVAAASDEMGQQLARQAARAGSAHAIGVLVEDHLQSPGVPSHPRQRWRVGFGPIDSHRPGWETATQLDDFPSGAEGSPADANGNDTPVDQLLNEQYTQYRGLSHARERIFAEGQVGAPGLARWIESGRYHSDLVGRPLSFHLVHPSPADPSAADPARRSGEPWLPDVDQPIFYDAGFRVVADRAAARYRVRYAVWIEDLNAQLVQNVVGPYVPGAFADSGVVPSAAVDRGAREVDAVMADRWIDSFTNLVSAQSDLGSQWPLLFQFRGIGMSSDWANEHPRGYAKIFSHFAPNGQPRTLDDWDRTLPAPPPGEPTHRYDQPVPLYWTDPPPAGGQEVQNTTLGLRGPAYSWEPFKWASQSNFAHEGYQFTPFGRAPRASATPTRWDEGYAGTPWQVNLPTATPNTLRRMIYAILPHEPRTYIYTRRTRYSVVNVNANTGSESWSGATTTTVLPGRIFVHDLVDLWQSATFASSFSWLGSPYPGTAPGAVIPGWRTDLGADIDISRQFRVSSGVPRSQAYLWLHGPWNWVELSDAAVPERIVWSAQGNNFYSLTPGNAYVYPDSYWWDVIVALLQTAAVVQAAWHDDLGGGWRGDPLAGRVRWPAVTGRPEFGAGTQFAIDHDGDGDGIPETPSLVGSVAAVDRLFLMNLGEHVDFLAAGSPTSPATGIYLRRVSGTNEHGKALFAFTPSHNIASLLAASPARITVEEARRMELVVNDVRLSFFGASPQYPDFRGIDLDHDGVVWCSGYAGGSAPVDGAQPGYGPIVEPARRFSLTGCFVFQQSRFFRMFVRGELFDELRQLPVASADLETVLAIDPDGSQYDVHGAPRTPAWSTMPAARTGLEDTQVLFQRWHRTLYQGSLAATAR